MGMIEVIEKGSAVHCVSAYEGDIVILGTDGVFDNLFIDEVVAICDEMLYSPGTYEKFRPLRRSLLASAAQRIVKECDMWAQLVTIANALPLMAELLGSISDYSQCSAT